MPRAAVVFTACTVVAVGAGALALGGDDGPPPARDALVAYLEAWTRGDDRGAAALTTARDAALEALTASRRGMDGGKVDARLLDFESGDASARAAVRWRSGTVPPFGYEIRLSAVEQDGEWRVRWRESAVHPALERRTRLGTATIGARRGDILDRSGHPLVTERPVMDVAVEVDRVRNAAAVAATVAQVVDVDAARLARAVRSAGRDQRGGRFVPVITLRSADWRSRRERLEAIDGLSFARGTAPLTPTRGFARATLGAVGPATAEQVERSGGRIEAGDVIGQNGLQERFERRLAGTPTHAVVVRYRHSGVQQRVLRRWRGRPGRSLRVLLDRDAQLAAESALGERDGNAALVAVEPSSGDILAVSNRPSDEAYDRALLGRYPPGSTFKVVTTAALLSAGLSVDEVVPCPPTATVDGRSFRNFEGGARGDVPFAESFASSCNTAFVSLTDRLGAGALPDVAPRFGLGRPLRPGVPAAAASVPEPAGPVNEAAAMIGQDRVLATPLAMAGVAATVAEGRWRAPRLLPGGGGRAGPPLDAAELGVLRGLMRSVVQSGTGRALAGVPGEVLGKSGTAEYGAGDPPPTHAWFIAARGDLALAVIVEGGASGGAVAAPVVQRFFAALDG